MKNIPVKKNVPQKGHPKPELKLSYYILLFSYVFVSVFIPRFGTFDSSSTKFFVISLLNLVSLFIFFTDTEYKKKAELRWGYFRSYIGIAFSLFLIISLLSFFNAINLKESVMNIVKIFTVFFSTYVIYVIIKSNRIYLQHIAIALTILLLIDCFTVFYGISEYINGRLSSIGELKSIYSNKNIFASALFVKLPVALWLMFFSNGWEKRLGSLSVFFAILATLFLSTRSFYLGLVLLFVALLIYAGLRYFTIRKKESFLNLAHYVVLLASAILIFYLSQNFLFPKVKDAYSTDIASRISTIKTSETSANNRLKAWENSYQLIKDHPILGVGSGNWKVAVLKYENKESRDFYIMYKNHNDFIEVTAETGIFGGLAYLSIFLLIIFGFIYAFRNPEIVENNIKYLFLPAFGILAYSVDAFFNFPIDRPEIQVLFAIYVAAAAVFFTTLSVKTGENESKPLIKSFLIYTPAKLIALLTLLFLVASAYILMLNVQSSRYQRYYYEDIMNGTYNKSAAYMIKGFPFIPNISSSDEPIEINKAYYLIHEGQNREAIDLLMKENSSPYDGRREFYLSAAYSQMGILDSAIIWGRRANMLKPMEYKTFRNLSIMTYDAGLHEEAMQISSEFAKRLQTSVDAWKLASNTCLQGRHFEKALDLLMLAKKYLPNDSSIDNDISKIKYSMKFSPYDTLYNLANQAINNKQYQEAHKLFTEFINKKPETAEGYERRANCLLNLHKYNEALLDLNTAFKKGLEITPVLLNLRGVLYYNLGKKDAACNDFKAAMEKGDADGKKNYQSVCEIK